MWRTRHRKWSEPCFVHLNGVWISYANSFVTLQILMYLNKCNIQITKVLRNICINAYFGRNRWINCLRCFMNHDDYFHSLSLTWQHCRQWLHHTERKHDGFTLKCGLLIHSTCAFYVYNIKLKYTAYNISGSKKTHLLIEKGNWIIKKKIKKGFSSHLINVFALHGLCMTRYKTAGYIFLQQL